MRKLHKGDHIKVTRVSTGVVTEAFSDGTAWYNRDDTGSPGIISLDDIKQNNIEFIGPPNWPPQVGDVWEAEGHEWFVHHSDYMSHDPNLSVIFRSADKGTWLSPNDFKRKNPSLVRRRGVPIPRVMKV